MHDTGYKIMNLLLINTKYRKKAPAGPGTYQSFASNRANEAGIATEICKYVYLFQVTKAAWPMALSG